MMDISTMTLEIEALHKEIARLAARRQEVIKQRQKACGHDRIAECDWVQSNPYSRAIPEWRICLGCRMTEVGWGPGFRVLFGEVAQKIARDDVYRMRLGLHIDDSMKGPLIRGEVTVEQLVDRSC